MAGFSIKLQKPTYLDEICLYNPSYDFDKAPPTWKNSFKCRFKLIGVTYEGVGMT
jgi:hypothetical protein